MNGLFASTMSAKAPAIRSMAASSARSDHAVGLERHRPPDEVRARYSSSSRPRLARSSSAPTISGSYQRPRRSARTADRLGLALRRDEDVEARAGGDDPRERVDRLAAQARAGGRRRPSARGRRGPPSRPARRSRPFGRSWRRARSGSARSRDGAVRPDSPIRIRRRSRSGSGSASGRLRIVNAA